MTTSANNYEVVIAGAGPAGVSMAMALVRRQPALRGHVLLLDRARFPRDKPCGGGLTGHVEEAMEQLGLELTVPSFPSQSAVVRYGTLRRRVELERPVRIVRRVEFDASLVEQARAAGIVVQEDNPMRSYSVAHGRVSVQTAKGPRSARVLVGADGAGSLVRKQLAGNRHRAGERETPIRLFRAELPPGSFAPLVDMAARAGLVVGGQAALHAGFRDGSMVYDFTPMRDGLRGYLWLFPSPGGRLNVGIMHTPTVERSGAELVEMLRAGLREHGVELVESSARGWPAWGYSELREVSAPHVLTVGDAAGIDALTGEGIAVGMEHALVAGEAITHALAKDDFAFRGYRKALGRASVGQELTLDQRLAWLLYGARGYSRWLSFVMYDRDMLEMYAARVSGTLVLARQPVALLRAIARNLLHTNRQRRALVAAGEKEHPSTTSAA